MGKARESARKRDAGATRALVAGESPLGGCVAGSAKHYSRSWRSTAETVERLKSKASETNAWNVAGTRARGFWSIAEYRLVRYGVWL